MKNIFLFLMFFINLIILSKEEQTNDTLDEDSNAGDDFYGYFKESLKDYLIKNKLLSSDREIQPIEMKKIFFEIVTEGGPESSPPQLRKSFDILADFFLEKYYSENKLIKGKDIYNLIDIDEIYNKFEEIIAMNPLYDKYEEEENMDRKDIINNDL